MYQSLYAIIKYSLLALSLIIGSPALHAGQLNLIINGKAIHLGGPTGTVMNENNWGLGLQYDYDLIDDKWLPIAMASGFIDSVNQPSYYAGGGLLRRYNIGQYQKTPLFFDVGIIAFLMTRNDHNNNEPFPGLLPAFSFGTQKVALNLTYIPKIHPKLIPLWFLQLKVQLGGR